MTEDEFWELVASCMPPDGDRDRWAAALTASLIELGEEATLDFHSHLDAARASIDTWIMWAIAWRIMGRCDDNDYFAFLHWLIAQGPDVVRAVRANPDAVAGLDAVRRHARARRAGGQTPAQSQRKAQASHHPFGFELLAYVAPRAYEHLTGEPDGLYDELEARGDDVAFGPEPGGPNVDPISVSRYAPQVARLFPMR